MPQAKPQPITREEATRAFVEGAFDDAYAIREAYAELVNRRKANREQLRSFAAQGLLDDEQVAEMDELYPKRTKAEEAAEDSAVAPADDNGGE